MDSASATSSDETHDSSPAAPDNSVLSSRSGPRCCWVTLVMRGDAYIPGALIMGHSFRLVSTKHELAVMVTDDVSQEARKRLEIVFDHVILVPYLKAVCQPLRTENQRHKYEDWIQSSFTKWNVLGFTQFDKVMFVDADKIVLSNIDDLFKLPAPAATFSNPWAEPFIGVRQSTGERLPSNSSLRRGYRNALYNPYVKNYRRPRNWRKLNRHRRPEPPTWDDLLDHGEKVSHESVDMALQGRIPSFAIFGTMVLLEPNKEVFEMMKEQLASYTKRDPYGWRNINSGFDEQFITEFICDVDVSPPLQWTHIHQKYNYIPWKKTWISETDVPRVIHFFGKTPLLPWLIDRDTFADLELWWLVVENLLEKSKHSEEDRAFLRECFNMTQYNKGKQGFCTWCKDRDQTEEVYSSHTTFDEDTGLLICPRLQPEFEDELKANERKQRYKDTAHLMQPSARWRREGEVEDIPAATAPKAKKKANFRGPRSFEQLMAEKKMRTKWDSQRKAAYARQDEEKEREEVAKRAKMIEAGKLKALQRRNEEGHRRISAPSPAAARKSKRSDVSKRPHPVDVRHEESVALTDFELPEDDGGVVKGEKDGDAVQANANGNGSSSSSSSAVKSEAASSTKLDAQAEDQEDDSPPIVKRGRGFLAVGGDGGDFDRPPSKRIRRTR